MRHRACGDPGTELRADRAGAAQLLAVLPEEALRMPTARLVAPPLHVDRDRTPPRTLATLLDVGTTPSGAVARPRVHRNTVTARLERLRPLGYDPGRR
ncbi:hypothetical protein OOK36_39080 [Streptomyces sp. NBC_00365]|uniref:hypothetical protein n=1 Tax=Streptomyces sp. NBC_00365 TaxID=2975726 RepID=UPI0022507FDD|nr:hypothetical protein [Streptomyces sp. NBC_00365]MCX5094757.1 hypothetical protein [Streptomyces sp. NBC_00365]